MAQIFIKHRSKSIWWKPHPESTIVWYNHAKVTRPLRKYPAYLPVGTGTKQRTQETVWIYEPEWRADHFTGYSWKEAQRGLVPEVEGGHYYPVID